MPNDKVDDHYISDARYELLLQAILNPTPSLDPRGQLIEALGEIGGLWPMSCLAERDPVGMTETAPNGIMGRQIINHFECQQRDFAKLRQLMTEHHSAMVALAKVGTTASFTNV